MAYALQAAKTKQRIVEEKMQIKVVERQQEISIQEQVIIYCLSFIWVWNKSLIMHVTYD